MSILRRIALAIKSYVADTSERLERVAAEEELRQANPSRPPEKSAPTPAAAPQDAFGLAADYRYLGLEPGAGLEAVEQAWRRLASRADPKKFPSGSDEERKAAEILRSLNDAYSRLREALHPTEGRFGQLEL
jgi:DnaJ-domain-containing protein 1